MHLHIESDVWIDQSPIEVFDFISEPENIPRYVSGIISAQKVSEGPMGVGAQATTTAMLLGRRSVTLQTYTRFDRGQMLIRESTDGPIEYILTDFLRLEGGGTRLRRVLVGDTRGFFADLAAPLIRRNAQRGTDLALATLKDLMEHEVFTVYGLEAAGVDPVANHVAGLR